MGWATSVASVELSFWDYHLGHGGYAFASVCLFVSKITHNSYEWMAMQFSGNADKRDEERMFTFWRCSRSDHYQDQGIFGSILHHCEIGPCTYNFTINGQGVWQKVSSITTKFNPGKILDTMVQNRKN